MNRPCDFKDVAKVTNEDESYLHNANQALNELKECSEQSPDEFEKLFIRSGFEKRKVDDNLSKLCHLTEVKNAVGKVVVFHCCISAHLVELLLKNGYDVDVPYHMENERFVSHLIRKQEAL